MTGTVARPAVEQAKAAVGVAFTINGLAIASWISRVPAARDDLGVTAAQLGLLLLCASGGSVLALPTSGLVVHRLGPARSALAACALLATGQLVIAGGLTAGAPLVAALGLFLLGVGIAVWDVSINVEGADVERRLGRSLMPRFHAGFSLGTVAGALVGAGVAALGMSLAVHLVLTGVVVLALLAVTVRWFLPVDQPEDGAPRDRSDVRTAWRERRTLLLGLMVLAFALTEGSAYDWLAVALVDGYGAGEALAAAGFAVFVAAMTVVRVVGTALLDRYGRVAVLRSGVAFTIVGVLLFVLAPSVPIALAGALLWGMGVALGFPVGMSAAADEARSAAARVSVVSSIGYTAFLAGPPLIGFLAEATGVLRALLAPLVVLAIGLFAIGAARPPRTDGRVQA